ncbi:hypothetical protein GCM10007084_09080 [Parabacteroides faecis]|nr:hypothetical protein GCM10007084_09080 [Parabacteroides faecis]
MLYIIINKARNIVKTKKVRNRSSPPPKKICRKDNEWIKQERAEVIKATFTKEAIAIRPVSVKVE